MSQFLKMISSNDFIHTTNIEVPSKDIQNQQLNSISSFKQIDMKEVGIAHSNQPFVIANTVFA
jgi:hypothetical protein